MAAAPPGTRRASRRPENLSLVADGLPLHRARVGESLQHRFCRHPMYVGELALVDWLGHSLRQSRGARRSHCPFYRRRPTGAKRGADLEATFGEQYREYMNAIPRWLNVGSRAAGPRG